MDKPEVGRPAVNNDNERLEYWEDLLKQQDLGEEQLGLLDDPTPDPEPIKGRRVSNRKDRTIEILETLVDKDDLFITGSQISKIRTEEKEIPDWALDNKRIREVLLQAFPSLQNDPKQRAKAAKWAAAIYLFYRMNMTYSQVAEELGISPASCNLLLSRISKVFKGLWASGKKGQRGLRKRGRPRKMGI